MNRRTALITATSIAGVVLAGGAAVGANVGILSAADDSEFGQLTAQATVDGDGTLPTLPDRPDGTTSLVTPVPGAQDSMVRFDVDVAGSVELAAVDGEVELGEVLTNAGWSWETVETEPGHLTVVFRNGDQTLELLAEVGDDGGIEARVDQPMVSVVPAPNATSGSGYDDDDHDEYDDDEYEDDDHDEYEEHEGRDDDD